MLAEFRVNLISTQKRKIKKEVWDVFAEQTPYGRALESKSFGGTEMLATFFLKQQGEY